MSDSGGIRKTLARAVGGANRPTYRDHVIAIMSFFLIVVGSLVVTRVATVALMLTGMSRESARFQARSALTGAGYTTTEAEAVVAHPGRRRIVMALMLLGSAGLVVAVVTLATSFLGADREATTTRVGVLLVGGVMLLLLARSKHLEKLMRRVFQHLLREHTDLDVRDYSGLLHLAEGYTVMRLYTDPEDWVANRSLGDLRLRDEGIGVLGIERADGAYVGDVTANSILRIGDTAIVYGRTRELEQLARRPAGAEGDTIHRAVATVQAHRVTARGGNQVVNARG